ncbi:MAG TPA: pseudouridine synthase [Solirubrobacteraceae bacterium]|jgi:23S rRNA pseudouridine2605 synthase|nr:pseudouridine synthase [Solirubrobacteraceae bacterium]
MRLAKHLAHAGVASRRESERIVASGRVRIDGKTVTDPARDVVGHERIELDGLPVGGPEPRVTYALHKPVGVVSTARDTHGRKTVLDLLPARAARLYPVGRLDADSSGLILLSNDGELANRLTHPSFEVDKSYRAKLGGAPLDEDALRRLRDGVELDDGPTAPARARRLGPHELELTIHEGRNRQVRRMCDALGRPVIELRRERFGPLRLDGLKVGEHRRLDEAELQELRAL